MVHAPRSRGGEAILEYKVEAGHLKLSTPAGWVSDIPFCVHTSGVFDLKEIFTTNTPVRFPTDFNIIITVKKW